VSQVVITQHDSRGESKPKQGKDPIWNEAIVFDIEDMAKPFIIRLMSTSTGQTLVERVLNIQRTDMNSAAIVEME
jgi:hypothetical protein